MLKYHSCYLVSKSKFEVENGILTKASAFYITNGEIQYIINNKSEIATAGDFVCFPTELYFERKITKPLTFYHIIFENPQKMALPYGKIFFADKERLLSNLEYLYNLELIPNENQNLKNHFLNDVFIQQMADISIKHTQKDEIVIKARTYFEKNIEKKITLEKTAKALGVSVPCLINHFNNATKTTPIKYLTSIRIKNAEKLLCTTNLSICEISEKCGFENPYYFSNTFKKYNKISPSKFRKTAVL